MQTYKGLDPVQQPHTEEGVDTEVGVETHRKGVAPHSEKGVHYLRVQAKHGQRQKKIQPCSQTFGVIWECDPCC